MIYAYLQAKELGADHVIEQANGDTFVCQLNPDKVDRSSQTPLEEQEIWRIKKISQYEDSKGNTHTVITYPNGNAQAFNFAISKIDTYQFSYLK